MNMGSDEHGVYWLRLDYVMTKNFSIPVRYGYRLQILSFSLYVLFFPM